jgi:hypothetical protein
MKRPPRTMLCGAVVYSFRGCFKINRVDRLAYFKGYQLNLAGRDTVSDINWSQQSFRGTFKLALLLGANKRTLPFNGSN